MPGDPEDGLNLYILALAILIAEGAQVALAQLHLGPFACLAGRMCQQCAPVYGEVIYGHICRLVLPSDVSLRAILYTSPKIDGVPDVVMVEAVFPDGSKRMRPSNTYKPRA